MGYERTVKLFRNGRNQAVRIPGEFELPGEDAVMRKEDGRLIIEARPKKETLLEVLNRLDPINEVWPEIVTANEREFVRVDGLAVENWLA